MRTRVNSVALLMLLAAAAAAIETTDSDTLRIPASGGSFTVYAAGENMLRWRPVALGDAVLAQRDRGEAFFNTPFVPAPAAATLRDGLGPLFNSTSCESCHNNLGRGRPVDGRGVPSPSLVLQLSIQNPEGAWNAHPRYGNSFQPLAVPGIPAEGQVRVHYHPLAGEYADGDRWELRQPRYEFAALGYGPLDATTTRKLALSPRMAQPLQGMGLLEAIPAAAILDHADEPDRDGDGVSGRPNWVPGYNSRRLGRFGWKASQPDIRAQVASALLAEQGISSAESASSNCAPGQAACLAAPDGGRPEIDARDLDSIVTFMRTVPVPVRLNTETQAVQSGAMLFLRAGCDDCHVPQWRTGVVPAIPGLANQFIYPFTDLLLHDMGPGLADGRPDQSATGSEWRTAPLWGIGRTAELGIPENYLHDGRARTLEEAILWHGGEATTARAVFATATRAEREALLAFLRSL